MMDPKLYKAAKEGDVSCLSGIDGRNITEEEAMRIQDGKFLKRTQHGNNNILHIAARAGRDTFVAEALRRFPFLSDQVNSQGDTPLLVAARFGHLQVVKTLADPNNELPMQYDDTATAVESGTNSRSSRRQRAVEEGPLDDQLEQATSLENGTNSRDMATDLKNKTNSSSRHRPRDVEEGLDDHQLEQGTIQDGMATAVENGTDSRGMATALENETNLSSSCRPRDVEEGLDDHQLEEGTIQDGMATAMENGTDSRGMATALENETNLSISRRPRDVEEGLDDHQLERGTVQDNVATVENGTNSSNICHICRCQKDVKERLLDAEQKKKNWLLDDQSETDSSWENETNSSSSHCQSDAEEDAKEVLVDLPMIQGTTALHEALRNGHEEVARYLLSLDPEMATLVNGAKESPLFLAAESRCESFMSDILQSNPLYSTRGPDGLNVLHVARDCPVTIISKLIKDRPHLMRELDNHGKAAIHHAVEAYSWDFLDEMLKADASIALFPDAQGYTALLRASSRGCWKICEKILQVCPESIEARNCEGQHALHLANRRNMGKIPPELWELLNVGDNEGNTPLHLAVKESHYEKAILLTSSASIYLGAVNKEGLTALDLCEPGWQRMNFKRLMWFHLRSHGASRGRHPNVHMVPVGGTHSNIRSLDEDRTPIINTLALVAALIATLTFAAAFTMPGGYDSGSSHPNSLGVAILAKKAALKVFLVSDSLAMCCSILALFLLLRAMRVDQEVTFSLTNTSSILIRLAFYSTLVAFISGISAVIAPKALWVAIVVCIICSMAPFLFFPTRVERYSSFLTLLRPTILIKDFQRLIQKEERMDKEMGVQHYVQSLPRKFELHPHSEAKPMEY